MTQEELAAAKIGDTVRLRTRSGKISQSTPQWFMVTWHDDGTPEVIKRKPSVLASRLELIPT